MPRVTFLPQNHVCEAQNGDTLLDVALENGIDLEHDCGGNCACTTCHVLIEDGTENVSPMEEVEEDRLSTAPKLQSNSRLGCQLLVRGDVTLSLPAEDLWE